MKILASFSLSTRWKKYGALFVGMALAGGCTSFVTENPYFTVKDSGLNWVEIRQYDMSGANRRVHVRIDGNGFVQVREGTSQQVSNAFAKQYDNSAWNDVRLRRITVSRDDAQAIFQQLVDAGLFVKERPDEQKPDLSKQALFVSANIQGKMTSSPDAVADPRLLEQLRLVVLMFYHPQPVRRN